MKYQKSYLLIHGLKSQGESNRFISDRLGISQSTVSSVINYKQKTVSKRSEEKILSEHIKLQKSKKKAANNKIHFCIIGCSI